MAEVPASKLVEAHGTFSTASCIRCHKSFDGEQIKVSLHVRPGRRNDLMVSALSLDGVVRLDPWPGSCRGGGVCTHRIHDGGSDGASHCEPRKILEPEI